MSYSRRSRYSSRSRSPYQYIRSSSRSLSRSRSRSRSRSTEFTDVKNPGNNLYVTGLSPRITRKELEKHFSSEGNVVNIHLVMDPLTRESRGFGFVTMATVEDAERCLKYLNQSVLEGRVITVEKARRRRGRTPTPGRYLGIKSLHVHRRSPGYSPYPRGRRYSSPSYSPERDRSYSSYYRRRYRSRSRSFSCYSSSTIRRRDRSYSPYTSSLRSYSRSPSPYYYRRTVRYRSTSPSVSPRRRHSRRSFSRSFSPKPRSYSRSISPAPTRRSHYRSTSPRSRSSSCTLSRSPRSSRSRSSSCTLSHSPRSYSRGRSYRSPSVRSYSRSTSLSESRSYTP